MVTLGVSTERRAVHAVAFARIGDTLTDRMVLRRTVRAAGDSKDEVAAAALTALDALADELDTDFEIAGAAVSYRDSAERRAIVTKLAPTRWHTASLVSAKSAHLFVAGAMTWLDEFDNLLVCEAVPGYQAMTLLDPARHRVLAAYAQSGAPTPEALRAGVSAAWDQFEEASVKPGAVVVIGASADAPAVREAIGGFGVPVLPCRLAAFAPAAGAALVALGETGEVPVIAPPASRRTTALVAAAASVLVAFLVAVGTYALMNGGNPAVGNTAVSSEPGAQPAVPPSPVGPVAPIVSAGREAEESEVPSVDESAGSEGGAFGTSTQLFEPPVEPDVSSPLVEEEPSSPGVPVTVQQLPGPVSGSAN
ncbi:hypothetical protein GCM10011591_41570 [Nocardia camponoti]|uniref:DUF7159 domain-containing protein n=1 Tax=Nocardia camponoti TaxID=1616106 RepID=A0A917QRK9_9NOCA|nr:hypothetical protein GCM10011591_41570 [Nocardia camponoti]